MNEDLILRLRRLRPADGVYDRKRIGVRGFWEGGRCWRCVTARNTNGLFGSFPDRLESALNFPRVLQNEATTGLINGVADGARTLAGPL